MRGTDPTLTISASASWHEWLRRHPWRVGGDSVTIPAEINELT